MINIARKMDERYQIPFFEGSFYGISDMSDSLRNIAQLLVEKGAPADLMARTEAIIRREEAGFWKRMEPYKDRLKGVKVLLITGGVKSWSVVAALQEGRDARCSLERTLHGVDVMLACLSSGETGQFVTLSTTCTRPAALSPAEARALLV